MKTTHERIGHCHCSQVKFKVTLPSKLTELSRCNCSMCSRRGAIVTAVPSASFELLEGAEVLSLYQFNTNTAEHYFCSVCGIYTHHRRRSDPSQYSINIACLEGIDPFDTHPVTLIDGRNHICDRSSAS